MFKMFKMLFISQEYHKIYSLRGRGLKGKGKGVSGATQATKFMSVCTSQKVEFFKIYFNLKLVYLKRVERVCYLSLTKLD